MHVPVWVRDGVSDQTLVVPGEVSNNGSSLASIHIALWGKRMRLKPNRKHINISVLKKNGSRDPKSVAGAL